MIALMVAELGREAADRITSATGGKAVFQQLDIGDQESIERFATWLENTHGGLTILVNNAGMQPVSDVASERCIHDCRSSFVS
jgi:NAD(P)-dependent dehydrogenase (short-subunit alcohol dehydrogenase family)